MNELAESVNETLLSCYNFFCHDKDLIESSIHYSMNKPNEKCLFCTVVNLWHRHEQKCLSFVQLLFL